MASNVISLRSLSDAKHPGRSINLQKLKNRDPVEMLNSFDKLNVEWRPYLSSTEISLLLLIFGQTIRWGRISYGFSYTMLEHGNKNTPGLNLSKDRLIKLSNGLHKRGIITKASTTRSMNITVNLDWTPAPETSPTPKRRNRTTPKAVPVSTLWGEEARIGSVENTNGVGIGSVENTLLVLPKLPLLEQAKKNKKVLEQAPLRRPSVAGAGFSEINLRRRPTGEASALPFPAKDAIPPVASHPLPEVRMRKRPPRLADVQRLLTPGAIEVTFRRAYEDTFSDRLGLPCPKWTRKQYGIAKRALIVGWMGTPQGLHDFVYWSVGHWEQVVGRKFQYRTRFPAPKMPDFEFLAKEHFAFENAFGENTRDGWLSGIDDRERKRFLELTVQRGRTDEEARMMIAEDRALTTLGGRIAKVGESNRSIFNHNKRLEKELRETKSKLRKYELHPESQIAKERAAAERRERLGPLPVLAPGEIPDLTKFMNIPYESEDEGRP